jgi:hypothetical protein
MAQRREDIGGYPAAQKQPDTLTKYLVVEETKAMAESSVPDGEPSSPPPFSHPTDPKTGRYACTPESPMPANAPTVSRWVHWGASEVPGTQTIRCPTCGKCWTEELPQ